MCSSMLPARDYNSASVWHTVTRHARRQFMTQCTAVMPIRDTVTPVCHQTGHSVSRCHTVTLIVSRNLSLQALSISPVCSGVRQDLMQQINKLKLQNSNSHQYGWRNLFVGPQICLADLGEGQWGERRENTRNLPKSSVGGGRGFLSLLHGGSIHYTVNSVHCNTIHSSIPSVLYTRWQYNGSNPMYTVFSTQPMTSHWIPKPTNPDNVKPWLTVCLFAPPVKLCHWLEDLVYGVISHQGLKGSPPPKN